MVWLPNHKTVKDAQIIQQCEQTSHKLITSKSFIKEVHYFRPLLLSAKVRFVSTEINEDNIRMDLIIKGAFFPHGKDIDGKHMLVFKCKMHTKSSVDMNDVKRCVVYWFERVERFGCIG